MEYLYILAANMYSRGRFQMSLDDWSQRGDNSTGWDERLINKLNTQLRQELSLCYGVSAHDM